MKLKNFLDLPEILNKVEEKEKEKIDPKQYGPKKVLMSWEAPGRSVKKGFNSRMSRALMMVAIVIGLILIIMQEFFLILVVASIILFSYAVGKMAPEIVKYEINTHGFVYDRTLYYWGQLSSFYFTIVDNLEILCINTEAGLPGRIYITLANQNKETVKNILDQYIHYLEKVPKSFFDNVYEKVLDKFNFKEE